jgi:hypothetical protein
MARAARSESFPLPPPTKLLLTLPPPHKNLNNSQIRMESEQKQGALFHAKAKITKLENRAKFAEVTGVLYNQ